MGYETSTIEEYFALPQDNSGLITKLPAKALAEIKSLNKHTQKINTTLKKYLINSRQAETNAKIVESLIS